MSIRFADDDFDGQFGRTLYAALSGSADLGEAFATADRITNGDMTSWYDEWRRTGDAVAGEALQSLDAGHPTSARQCFLRAAEYYRQAFFYVRDDLDSQRLHDTYAAHRAAFRDALALLDEDGQAVAIPYDGTTLNGYLLRPDASGTPRPTVLLPAGYDSTAESGFVDGGAATLARGMNVLQFEGPGQGGVLYDQRLPFRHDYEAVLTPVIDWLVTRPGIDPDSLVLFGRSFAGYLAPRGATAEHRPAALVCDPVQYDFGANLRARMGPEVWARVEADDTTLDHDLAFMLEDPARANFFRSRMVTHGTSTLVAYFRELSTFSIRGLADRITCPTLVLEADGDVAASGQTDELLAALTCPRASQRFTAAEGAGGHCEGLGQRRMERVVFDWLETVLDRPAD